MEQNKDQIGAAVRGEAVAEIEPADLMARFEKWKAYPLPALNSDGHFDKDWLHREFVAFKAGIVSAGAADAPSEPGELPTTIRDGMHWPEGYVTDPNGKIIPPKGRFNDFEFGYNVGYGEGLQSIKDTVANIGAQAVAKSRAADALDSQPSTDEQTDREALIACLGDDAATLSHINPDDEMAQTMREAAAMLENDGKALDSQPTYGEGWVLAKQTVIEMPNGKNELGYTLMEGVGIFTSFDEVVKAIKELSLPLGWVGITTLQLLPGWQIPEAPAISQPTDGGVRNGSDLEAVHAFLMGESPLEGVQFGDKHPTKAGAQWWRLNLRAALAKG